MTKITIMFEKNGLVVFHTHCPEKHCVFDGNNVTISDSFYYTIGEDMYRNNNLRIRDCTEATLHVFDSTTDHTTRYFVEDLQSETLVFKKEKLQLTDVTNE